MAETIYLKLSDVPNPLNDTLTKCLHDKTEQMCRAEEARIFRQMTEYTSVTDCDVRDKLKGTSMNPFDVIVYDPKTGTVFADVRVVAEDKCRARDKVMRDTEWQTKEYKEVADTAEVRVRPFC